MKPKPIIPRVLALRDIDQALQFYIEQALPHAASNFVDALEAAFIHLGRHSSSGSPRIAQWLDIPGLRSWPLRRFPFVVFYFEHDDYVDVWRVLDGRRDLPAWLDQN